jgi:PDZ domain-containing protein
MPARRRSVVLTVVAVVAAVGLLAASWIPLPYYSVGPGPAREVVPLIHVEGRTTYDSGTLIMTTVSFRQLTAVTALITWLDPDRSVVSQHILYPGGETVAEEHQRSLSQMDTSKIAATAVVLQALTGYRPISRTHEGVLIEGVTPGCPAEGKLFAGDQVTSIDGTPILDVPDASAAIEAVKPGVPITFHVVAGGEAHDVAVARGSCGDQVKPLVGITMVNDFPFDVSIASGDVGGPSAGLMYSLGLYDLLTPGDLTDGRVVAGTGEMYLDGTVGPIGGITDKIVAARDVGATLFLCPKDNYAEATTADAGDMKIVPVASFDDALRALGQPPPSLASPSPSA